MRQPDINRIRKVREHLDACRHHLDSVKYEKISGLEYELKRKLMNMIQDCNWLAKDIINIAGGGK